MDILAGRKTTGTITGGVLFGKPSHMCRTVSAGLTHSATAGGNKLSSAQLRELCGYVEQFDTLVGELTVFEVCGQCH